MFVISRASLILVSERLKAFLPQLEKANTELDDEANNLEDVDEDEEYIEMVSLERTRLIRISDWVFWKRKAMNQVMKNQKTKKMCLKNYCGRQESYEGKTLFMMLTKSQSQTMMRDWGMTVSRRIQAKLC